MAGASSSGVSCVVEVSPLADALLPTYQMKDLRRLEASIRHTLCTLEREEKHFRVVLLVVLSSSLYFAWNPLSRAYACIRAVRMIRKRNRLFLCLAFLSFFLFLFLGSCFSSFFLSFFSNCSFRCNNVLYFESRKRDLLLHMSKIPHGPTVIFRVLNIHTLAELSMTGNCLLHSRPLLLFSPDFGTDASPDGSPKPHLALIKELLIQIFGTPRNHPKAKPFFDHAMAFYRFDGDRLWFRHYQ
ncbi:brix domain-containing protein, partial [Cystoisospora suis]